MTSNKNKKQSQPLVDYQPADDSNGSLDKAFDILFEETLRQMDDLTPYDN
ncbi:MAG: hypothetical protein V1684_00415 [bacterium]